MSLHYSDGGDQVLKITTTMNGHQWMQSEIDILKKEYPLAVKRKDYIVVVTKENISIERNVL